MDDYRNIYIWSGVMTQLSVDPFTLCLLLTTVICIYPLTVGLTVLEVASPIALPEKDLASPAALVLLVMSFVADPVSPKDLDVLLIDLFLSLPHLNVRVLDSAAMEETVLKFTLVPQFFAGKVKLTEAMHFSLVPVSDVGLSILMLVQPLALPHRLLFVFVDGDGLSDIAGHARSGLALIGVSQPLVGDHRFCGMSGHDGLFLVESCVLASQSYAGFEIGCDVVGKFDIFSLQNDVFGLSLFLLLLLLLVLVFAEQVYDKFVDELVGRLCALDAYEELPKGQSGAWAGLEQILDHADQGEGVFAVHFVKKTIDFVVIHLARLIVIDPVQVSHGHQGKHHHAETESIRRPPPLKLRFISLQGRYFFGRQVNMLDLGSTDVVLDN